MTATIDQIALLPLYAAAATALLAFLTDSDRCPIAAVRCSR